jgi:phosphatidylglycerophosphate synthase
MTRASQITMVRAVGAAVCAGLVGARLMGRIGPVDGHRLSSWVLALVAGPALLLDAVDGRVARRDGEVTRSGARFDVEVDAALMAILSLAAAAAITPFALVVGAARYLFVAGRRIRPLWRAELPERRSRKVLGGTIAALMWATSVPWLLAVPWLALGLVGVAVTLVLWSFGRDIVELESGASFRDETPPQALPTRGRA